jgi:3-hydroxy-D-aspartate aldolase
MKDVIDLDAYEVGFDIPAKPGMDAADIQTPALVLDLDALERNIKKMGDYAKAHGMRHRAHGKMHKSVDVLKLQMELGGAIGVCCQKVSEAEVFVRGGIKEVLVEPGARSGQDRPSGASAAAWRECHRLRGRCGQRG